jgi:hypothetical protein
MSIRFDSKSLLLAAAAAFSLLLTPMHAAPQQNTVDAKVSGKGANPAAAKPTPRLASGHVDLNGVWFPWSGHVIRSDDQSREGVGETEKNGSVIVLYDQNRALIARTKGAAAVAAAPGQPRREAASTPSYKSELLAKVQDLETHQNRTDPSFQCLNPGIPRIGPPHEIIQSDKKVAFIYSDVLGNFWRIIPTDGRPHNADADPSFLGDSIGHWEGDTLVVDDTNFNDETWIKDGGYFHSTALHVTERLTRNGDSLLYEVRVEDPNVLTEPWILTPRTLKLSNVPIEEAPPCKEQDESHFTSLDHHDGIR